MARRQRLEMISAEARADMVRCFRAERGDGIGFSTNRIMREIAARHGCSVAFLRSLLIEKGAYTTKGWDRKREGVFSLRKGPYRHDLTASEERAVESLFRELSADGGGSYPTCWKVSVELGVNFQKVINYIKHIGLYV